MRISRQQTGLIVYDFLTGGGRGGFPVIVSIHGIVHILAFGDDWIIWVDPLFRFNLLE
jgi:hypothetical protein